MDFRPEVIMTWVLIGLQAGMAMALIAMVSRVRTTLAMPLVRRRRLAGVGWAATIFAFAGALGMLAGFGYIYGSSLGVQTVQALPMLWLIPLGTMSFATTWLIVALMRLRKAKPLRNIALGIPDEAVRRRSPRVWQNGKLVRAS